MSHLRGTFTFWKYLPEQAVATRIFRVSPPLDLSLQMQSLDFRRMMVIRGEDLGISRGGTAMNGSTGNKASGASEKPEPGDVILSLSTAQRMLPLVQRIVEDVLKNERALVRLQPEQEKLFRQRRSLAWPERQRRYQIQEEIDCAERNLTEAHEEMQRLGLTLLDAEIGRVGFPTLVNDRRAFFSWQPGEEGLQSWHFAEETTCRPIPAAWMREISLARKS
jgi:hypothetical protein